MILNKLLNFIFIFIIQPDKFDNTIAVCYHYQLVTPTSPIAVTSLNGVRGEQEKRKRHRGRKRERERREEKDTEREKGKRKTQRENQRGKIKRDRERERERKNDHSNKNDKIITKNIK